MTDAVLTKTLAWQRISRTDIILARLDLAEITPSYLREVEHPRICLMAKRRQLPTLDQIESQLGYKLDYLDNADKDVLTFYSDLTPVPKSSYERALRELDEARQQKVQEAVSSHELPLLDAPKIVTVHGDTVVAECSQNFGLYRFIVRINHETGFRLPLRLTERETSRFITVTKFQAENGYKSSSVFFRLPRELRDRVYMFCIPDCEWKIADADIFNSTTFVEAMGDLTGFYFPLHNHLSVLLINKQIRQEALPIAYRRTFFRLDDIDDFIKVAISIGQIGRANIESVQFSWESRSDLYHGKNEYSEPDDNQSQLPALHVSRCVQLLKECHRLAFLRIYFERHVLSNMSFADFQANTGIRELSSIRGIRRVQIESAFCEPLDDCEVLKWLKRKLESRGD